MKKSFFVLFFLVLSCAPPPPAELTESGQYKPIPSQTPPASDVKNMAYTGTVFIASVPPAAKVYMDGKYIGEANSAKLKVKPGKHRMRLVAKGKSKEVDMEFKEGDNGSKIVKISKN
jgi:hypothetical protein